MCGPRLREFSAWHKHGSCLAKQIHDEDHQIHVHRQAIKTDSKGAGGDDDAPVNAMVVYIFEAGRAFQAENDAGMADRVECVVKYDRGNRCEKWLNQFYVLNNSLHARHHVNQVI